MITIRRADERGRSQHGWLDSRHSFSFADYYDPEHMGISVLRVINEDRVAPGAGFATHSHRDMEIISYVLEGILEHKDSMGNGSVIRPGEVQRMSAGTGVTHSEYNASKTDPLHFLQIWILPKASGITPSYEQKRFAEPEGEGPWCLLAASDGRNGSLTVHQDVLMYVARLSKGEAASYSLATGRKAYMHVARGEVSLDKTALVAGDGVAIIEEEALSFSADSKAEVLLFDLP